MTSFDLVIYMGGDWKGYHRRQMLLALALKIEREGKILCVERPVCPLTTPLRRPLKFREWVAGKRGIRQVAGNLFIYTPWVVIHDQLASRLPVMVLANRVLLSRLLRKALGELGFRNPIRLSWIYNPLQIDYTDLVGEIGYIYECLDYYPEVVRGTFSSNEIERREDCLVRDAMVVFSTAHSLYDRNKKINSNSFYTPNGVNLALFQQSLLEADYPSDLSRIPKPHLGFVGRVDNAFVDCDLLEAAARRNPGWSFVFIGPVTEHRSVQRLRSLPNTFFLGYKPYEILPAYMGAFATGLIPFRINQITKCLNPLKLYEYMAAGCPVVSTDLPEVRQHAPLVRVVRDIDSFVEAIKATIDSDRTELREALKEEARQHSWDERVAKIIRIIREYAA